MVLRQVCLVLVSSYLVCLSPCLTIRGQLFKICILVWSFPLLISQGNAGWDIKSHILKVLLVLSKLILSANLSLIDMRMFPVSASGGSPPASETFQLFLAFLSQRHEAKYSCRWFAAQLFGSGQCFNGTEIHLWDKTHQEWNPQLPQNSHSVNTWLFQGNNVISEW